MKKYQIATADMRNENNFHIKKLGEYQDLYNMGDISFLLAFLADFKIDINGNFLTLSLFSLECTLKLTRVEYILLTDFNKLLDYENVIRGGITRVIYYYAEANSKYIYIMKK